MGLSSCGQSGEDSSAITIHFWHTFGQDIQASVQSKINSFEKLISEKENVDVDIQLDYQGGYSDIESKILRGFSTGNTPTIAVAYPDHVADYLNSQTKAEEFVVNLENYFNDPEIGFSKEEYLNPELLGEEDYVASFMKEGRDYLDDGVYSLPFMKSTEVMFYDETNVYRLLNDYDPTIANKSDFMRNLSWEKFMDVLKFAKTNGLQKYGTNLEIPLIYDSDSNLFITDSIQNGIDYVSIKDNKGSIDFNNDKSKAMVSELKEYYDQGLFLTKGTNNNEYGSNKFTASQCLFSIGSSGGAGFNDPGAASFKVGVCKVPSLNENNISYVSQGPTLTLLRSNGVTDEVNSARVKYAWKFLKYITNTENNAEICLDSNGYIPVRESSFKTSLYTEYLQETDFMPTCTNVVYNDINGKYLNSPVFKGTATARTEVGGIITQVLLGKKTIDEAYKEAYSHTVIDM